MTLFSQVEVTVAAVIWLLAVASYARVPWWKSIFGRLLFSTILSIALVVSLVALSTWFGDFPGRDYVRYVVYSVSVVTGLLVLFGIIYAQMKGVRSSNVDAEVLEGNGRASD